MSDIYGTDNGPSCAKCSGRIWRYFVASETLDSPCEIRPTCASCHEPDVEIATRTVMADMTIAECKRMHVHHIEKRR